MGKKKQRHSRFDPRNFTWRRIALRCSYLGYPYQGLAFQAHNDNTVEHHVLEALKRTNIIVSAESAVFERCGRTDSAVSAREQVFSFNARSRLPREKLGDSYVEAPVEAAAAVADDDGGAAAASGQTTSGGGGGGSGDGGGGGASTSSNASSEPRAASTQPTEETSEFVTPRFRYRLEPDAPPVDAGEWEDEIDYVGILNHILPADIRITGFAPVRRDFSARFCALQRTYHYYFARGDLDVAAMRAAVAHFVGEHDFRNFCKVNVEATTNHVRVVHEARIEEVHGEEDMFVFVIKGTAFLWHQIRCMIAILLYIGQHAEEPSLVRTLLDVEQYPSKPLYAYAPPENLVLHACAFSPSDIPAWRASRTAGERVEAHWRGAADAYRVKAVTARKMCLSTYEEEEEEEAAAVAERAEEEAAADDEVEATNAAVKEATATVSVADAAPTDAVAHLRAQVPTLLSEQVNVAVGEGGAGGKGNDGISGSGAKEGKVWRSATLGAFAASERIELVKPTVRGKNKQYKNKAAKEAQAAKAARAAKVAAAAALPKSTASGTAVSSRADMGGDEKRNGGAADTSPTNANVADDFRSVAKRRRVDPREANNGNSNNSSNTNSSDNNSNIIGRSLRVRRVVRSNSVLCAMETDRDGHQPILSRPLEASLEARVALSEARKAKKEERAQLASGGERGT